MVDQVAAAEHLVGPAHEFAQQLLGRQPDVHFAAPHRAGANSAAAGAQALRLTITRLAEKVVIEAADDGPGFPPDFLDTAFERFARADTARTRGTAGAGLGLPIVRSVVTAHGGTVEARNGLPLGGAVITMRLPAESPG